MSSEDPARPQSEKDTDAPDDTGSERPGTPKTAESAAPSEPATTPDPVDGGSPDTAAGTPADAASASPETADAIAEAVAEDGAAPPDEAASGGAETPAAGGDAAPAPDQEAEAPEPVRFEEFGLPRPLMDSIRDLGFEHCTPIQAETLPHALSDYDITGQAQTGTGKTAAFLIAIIAHQLEHPLDEVPPVGTPRGLIIAPTRELAMQIADDAVGLTKHVEPMNVVTVVGGMDFDRQLRILETQVVDILVATPGRLLDFVTRGKVNLRKVDQLVLDEADRMLSMGFIPDVRRIIRQTPPKRRRQTLLFSATFNEDVLRLASQWTLAAEHVVIEPESVATDTVEQRVYLVSAKQKFALLYNLMDDLDLDRVIVFANRRDTTRRVQERLAALGIECELLSGEVPQNKRLKTLERFKGGKTRVLAATDVAGRGLHVEGISHVINYDLPEDPEDYVHRIGRTGRAGATGISISFVGETDAFLLPEIEQLLGQRITCSTPQDEMLVAPDEPDRPKESRSRGPRRDGGRDGRGRGGPRGRR